METMRCSGGRTRMLAITSGAILPRGAAGVLAMALALAAWLALAPGAWAADPVLQVPGTGVPTYDATLGSYGTGDGLFSFPYGLGSDSAGNVYVMDRGNSRVQKLDADGNFLLKWGSSGSGDGQFSGPYNLTVDSSGNVFVADMNNNRVQKFDSSGNFLLKWGTSGSGDGQLDSPRGIAVDSSDNVYVVDAGNHRVQKFDTSGDFLMKWGSFGSGDGQFLVPQTIEVDGSDNVYVADINTIRVQQFDTSGNFVRNFTPSAETQGLGSDTAGQLHVAETFSDIARTFDSSAVDQGTWGTSPALNDPRDIDQTVTGYIYVADAANNRIQRFLPPLGDAGASIGVTMDEDGTPTAFSLLLFATDGDGDTITWSISSAASNGTADVSGTGAGKAISYTPNADFNGADSFEVQIDDGNGGTDTVTVNVTVTAVNDPPTLATSPSAASFTEDGGAIVVDPALTVSDVEDDPLDGASVSIASGFVSSEDVLSFTPQHGVTGSFDSTTGILTLSGSATPTEYQDVLRSVTYNNTNGGAPDLGDRTITFVLGSSLFFTETGHFYEFVTDPGATWSAAKTAAEGLSYYGLQGYLVTITSAGENSFAFSKLSESGWIGASDADAEGTWRWKTGPEGLEVSGQGRHFFTQTASGSGGNYGGATPGGGVAENGYYHNWYDDGSTVYEPNDWGDDEDYAHLKSDDGTWNDWPLAGGPANGYVVEYGGMPGDPALQISGSRTVEITPQNDVPVIDQGAGPLSVTMSEDGTPTPWSSPTLGATDPDVIDTLTWSVSSAASNGTATVSGTGASPSTFTYAPDANWHGADSFEVQVSDGNGGTDTITVNVTVESVNDPPVIDQGTGTTATMDEDGAPTAWSAPTVSAADTDGDTLTWTVSTPALNGTATVSGTGASPTTFTYAPNANWNGLDTFDVQVSDGNGGTDTIAVVVTVNAVNDAPQITEGASTSVTMSEEGTPTSFSLTLNATDTESDTITWSISSQASNGTATASGTGTSKAIGYTPNANFEGADSFDVQIDDGNGGTDTITVNVTVENTQDPVTIDQSGPLSVTMDEDGAPTAWAAPTLTATDPDSPDTLTWSVSSAASHGTATVSGTGTSPATFTYAPEADWSGSDSFEVQVSDGNGSTDTITVNVTVNPVNDPPMVTSAAASFEYSAKWGSSGTGNGEFSNVRGVCIDASGNVYVADTSNHRIQKFSSDGTFVLAWGNYGWSANDDFAYPTGVAVDSSGNVYVANSVGHRIQKFNSNGSYLARWGSNGAADGQFNLPYDVAVDGSDNVYVVDTDNNRIQKFTSSGSHLLTWGSYGPGNGQFDNPLGIAVTSGGDVYVTDSDNHRVQQFTSSGAFVRTWGSEGTGDGQFTRPTGVAVDASGNVYVTGYDNHRAQQFTSDGTFLTKWGGFGSGDGQLWVPFGIDVDASGNVYVADTGNNRIQVFTYAPGPDAGGSVAVTMSEDGAPTAFALTLHAVDKEWDTITWSISSAATNGTASVSGTGTSKSISYTPNANFNGSDSFDVQVDDGNGGTDTITVNVTVNPVNDPVAIDQTGPLSVTMDEDGSPTAWSAPTVTAADMDTGDTLTWSVSSPASNGTATVSGTGTSPTTFDYAPAANFNGSDSFVVQVSDGNGSTDTITVNVTVQPQPDAPSVTAWPSASTITYGQALSASTLSGGTASAAGTFAFSDPSATPGLGTHTVAVTFIPDDTVNYSAAAGTVDVTVEPTDVALRIVEGPLVTSVTHESALVEWRTNRPADSHVAYGPTIAMAESVSDPAEVLDHRMALTGLSGNTTYYVRVSSTETTKLGAAKYGSTQSDVFTFTTLPAPDTDAPVILAGPAATDLTETEVLFTWTTDEPATSTVSVDDGGGPVEVSDDTLTMDHALHVAGLTAATTYTCTVSSVDLAGNGPTESAPFTHTTLEAPDVTAPEITEGPLAIEVVEDAFVVRWLTDEPSDSVVEYGTTAAAELSAGDTDLVTEHAVTVSELTVATTYHFRASSMDASGNGPTASPIFTVDTADAADTTAPVITVGPIVIGLTDTTATVYWETNERSDSVVEYGPMWTGIFDQWRADAALVFQHQITLVDLTPGGRYDFRVSSADAAGNMVVSIATTKQGDSGFQTLSEPDTTAPVIETAPTVVGLSDTSAVVHWTTDELADGYVDFGLSGGVPDNAAGHIVDSLTHVVVLTGLTPDTAYDYQVRSVDTSDNGPTTSNLLTFSTLATPDEDAPAFIDGPAVSDETKSSAVIEWQTDEFATTQILYGTVSGNLDTLASVTGMRDAHRLILANLAPGTTYYFKAVSLDESQNKAESTEGTFSVSEPSDLNGDGVINSVDVQLIINAVLSGATGAEFDVNGDGEVNAADIQAVINATLGR